MERRVVGSRQASVGGNAPHQHDRHDQSTAAESDAEETAEAKGVQAHHPDGWEVIQTNRAESRSNILRRPIRRNVVNSKMPIRSLSRKRLMG